MRLLAVIAGALALSGCVHEPLNWGNCKDGTLEGLVGQPFDAKMDRMLRDRSHASYLRTVRPGEIVTTDYRRNRLTVDLDERGRIARARCG